VQHIKKLFYTDSADDAVERIKKTPAQLNKGAPERRKFPDAATSNYMQKTDPNLRYFAYNNYCNVFY